MQIDRLAERQYGLATRQQLLDSGLPARTRRRWAAEGRLAEVFPGVYRVAGAPETWTQRQLAAVLAGGDGAAASHRAAARLWGLSDDAVHEITVAGTGRPSLDGVVVHRTSAVPRLVPRQRIPTTDPLRTLMDLGAVVSPDAVEDALDRALVSGLVSVPAVKAAVERVATNGRNGAGVLRRVLAARALGDDSPDSLLEPRMARLLRRHRLPAAVFQYEVWHGGRFVARIDFAYPEVLLAIEVDGLGTHGSARALQSDLRRQNALVGLGWTVLRFTWADVVRRPAYVAAEIERALVMLASA